MAETIEGFNPRAALVVVLVMALAVGLIAALSARGGPASQCEARGGLIFSGPGGETSCVSRQTFLPLEGFEQAPR